MNFWVVGKSLGEKNKWEFAGVFDTEDLAVAACLDRNYFIAPAEMNKRQPHISVDWEGLRWPIAEKE